MRAPHNLLICALVVVIVAATVASAYEVRLIGTQGNSGTESGRLVIQSTSSASWKSVCYTSFTSTDARAFCQFLGWQSSGLVASYSTTSTSLSYPTGIFSVGCSSTVIPSPTSLTSYCSFTTSGSCSTNVYLTCSGTRDGGNVGVYVGSFYMRRSSSLSRLEFRNDHSSTWYSICHSSVSTLSTYRMDSTTGRAVCGWFSYTGSTPTIGATTAIYTQGMRSLDCSSSSYTTIDSCSYVSSSACASTSNYVTLSCSTSSTPSPSSPSSPSSSVPDNLGVIIGASVGGFIGLVIFIVVCVTVCSSMARASSAGVTNGSNVVVLGKSSTQAKPIVSSSPTTNFNSSTNFNSTSNGFNNSMVQQPQPGYNNSFSQPPQPQGYPGGWGAPPPPGYGPPPPGAFGPPPPHHPDHNFAPGYGPPPSDFGQPAFGAPGAPPPFYGPPGFGAPPPQQGWNGPQ